MTYNVFGGTLNLAQPTCSYEMFACCEMKVVWNLLPLSVLLGSSHGSGQSELSGFRF